MIVKYRRKTLAFLLLLVTSVSHATIIELGDLNIINDIGNSSNGLRYLDMTFSDGLTEAAALTNAQATYANARLATVSEFDDIFAAAGISLLGVTAADAYATGGPLIASSGSDYDGGVLRNILGATQGTDLNIWTAPDNSGSSAGTRDFITLINTFMRFSQFSAGPLGNYSDAGGFLLVSESAAVPEPSTLAIFGLSLAGIGFARRKKA
jgi:hypothetical protein